MYWFHKILWIKNKQKKDFTEVKPLLMDLFDCMFCDPHGVTSKTTVTIWLSAFFTYDMQR